MKKLAIASLLLVTLANSSCKKFLDTEPVSTKSIEEFFTSADDAELAIAGCYSILNAQYVQGVSGSDQGLKGGLWWMQMPIMMTGSTDELTTRVGFSDATNSPWGFAAFNSTSTYIGDTWTFFYVGIGRCNTVLDNIDRINMPDARKQEIKGEAKFLRGLFYMYLGMMYGGVPISITSELKPDAPRNTVQEVFTQVIADLEAAKAVLPNRASITGRANKWSAAGFLAKTYAFLGSCKMTNAGADLNFSLNSFSWVDAADAYAKVKTYTDDIIANSGYILSANYHYLFLEMGKKYLNEECLFTIESSENPAAGNYINMQNLFIAQGPNATVGGGLVRLVPLGEVWYKYHNNDPRRTNNLSGQYNVNTSPKETVDGSVYYVPLTITATSIKNNLMYYTSKFRMLDPATKKITLNFYQGNWPLLRLADIYMLRAEAIYFINGNLNLARADLSTVRARSIAAANLAAVNTSYVRTDFIQELLDERCRELCFEGWRHIDLMRFNRLTSTINALTTDKSLASNNQSAATMVANWAPYRIWMPLPYDELILNPNLVQNPGY